MPTTLTIPGRARFTFRVKELEDLVRRELIKRIHLAVEDTKNAVIRNLSTPTRSAGPSKPGEYPHSDTGRLRNSIFTNVDEEAVSGIVGTNLDYGLWLEYGVPGGGVIKPVTAKALSWIDPKTGERIFAKSVTRGAIEGRSYLRRTMTENRQRIVKLLTAKFPDLPSGGVAFE